MQLPPIDIPNLQGMRHVFLYMGIPSLQTSSISFNLGDTCFQKHIDVGSTMNPLKLRYPKVCGC